MTQLATLGGSATTNNARKFFYAPDIVPTSGYNAIMAGTGDREHPLYSASTTPGTAYNVVNRFYMIKDPNTGIMPSSWTPITEANLVDLSSTTKTYDGTGSGYYITLPNPGEKVVNAPLTVAGYTTFGTNTRRCRRPARATPTSALHAIIRSASCRRPGRMRTGRCSSMAAASRRRRCTAWFR